MKKQAIRLVLGLLIAAGFTACNDHGDSKSTTDTTTTTTVQTAPPPPPVDTHHVAARDTGSTPGEAMKDTSGKSGQVPPPR